MTKDNLFEEVKLYVKLNGEGYITSIAVEPYDGHIETGMTMAQFISNHARRNVADGRHKFCNGQIIFDGRAKRNRAACEEALKKELREERARICFPVVNRGTVWYKTLTEEQRAELESWYDAWLRVTETLVSPETPVWVKK